MAGGNFALPADCGRVLGFGVRFVLSSGHPTGPLFMSVELPRPTLTARLCSAMCVVVLLMVLGAGSVGAAPEETIELPFEALSLEHDATTDLFFMQHLGPADTSCGRHAYSIVDRSGAVQWDVPAPMPCAWVVDGGRLFVSVGNSIRWFDLASGALVREWTLDESVTVGQMFLRGPSLWFNQSTSTGGIGPDEHVGVLFPAVQNSVGVVFNNTSLVAASSDGRFLWLYDPLRTLTRFDQSGETDQLDMPRIDNVQFGAAAFYLTADEQLLYVGGQLFDATTLEQLTDPGQQRVSAMSYDELADGRVIGVGGRRVFQNNGLVRLFEAGTLDLLAHGHYASAADSGNPHTDAVVIDEPGVGERLAISVGNRIEFHSIVPALNDLTLVRGPGTGPELEAGTPATVHMGVDWIDAVDTISLDGQPLTFRPVVYEPTGEWLALEVDIPALPVGSHPIVFDGPLGPSSGTDYITVVPAKPRSDLEVIVRSDSRGGAVTINVSCSDPTLLVEEPIGLFVQEEMRAGDRLTVRPLIGDTCTVSFERPQHPDLPLGYAHYLTAGFFDPVNDPGAWNMLDFHTQQAEFVMPARSTGFAVFVPDPDEIVLWTYGYGFGQASTDEPTVSIDCPGSSDDATYRVYYGYWYRSVVPAQGCMLHHPAPASSLGSGWAGYNPDLDELDPYPSTHPRRAVGAGPLSTVFTIDIYPHPAENDGAFVRQQYLDFLGRPADAGGLQYWEDALASGTRQRTDLVQLFLGSPEFGQTVAPINRLYSAYFDRAPDRQGLFFWVDWIRGGRSLAQVSEQFARSPEFERTYGALSDEAFIDLVYRNVLARRADAGGRAFWIDRMASGLTRGQLMVSFSESAEYVDQTRAAVLVESLYQGLLQRSPDPGGFTYWVGVADSGAPISSLIAGMLSSDEYYNRFGVIVDQLPTAARLEANLVDADPAYQVSR